MARPNELFAGIGLGWRLALCALPPRLPRNAYDTKCVRLTIESNHNLAPSSFLTIKIYDRISGNRATMIGIEKPQEHLNGHPVIVFGTAILED